MARLRSATLRILLAALAACSRPAERAPPVRPQAESTAPTDEEPRGRFVDEFDLGFEAGSGWALEGGELDGSIRRFGQRSARLRAGSALLATAGRHFPIEPARGRRVRLCGWIRTEKVTGGHAGLWLRVHRGPEVLALNNMQASGLRGDTGWTRVEVVVDVPVEATSMLFGGLVTGEGTAWIDGLDIILADSPGTSAAVTGIVRGPGGVPAPGAIVAVVPELAVSAAAVVTTDDQGRFRAPVRAGRYAVTATAPGTTAAYHPPVPVADGEERTVAVELGAAARGFHLTGVALDGNGRPLAGALVHCIRYSQDEGDIFYARTGSDGGYQVGLLRAAHRCSAMSGENRSSAVEVADGTVRLDFRLDHGRPAPAAVVDWVRRSAIPLLTVQPGHGFADMRPLRELVGSARVVALGEATHGTREFFQMKHRVFEYLVAELGFTVFAIEASFPESEAVNDYILTGRGDPARALAGLHFWTWDTEEVRDLIAWMRDWNADPRHRRKLQFYGFDMQFGAAAAAGLVRFVARVEPDKAEALRARLAPFSANGQTAEKEIGAQADALRTALRETGERLDRERARYRRVAGRRAHLVARQLVRILEQNLDLTLDDANGTRIRDRAMADNLRWIADVAEPGARVVAWAHNSHVAHLDRGGVEWMGRHLERALGRDYLPIGFSFHRGSFQAIDQTGTNRGLAEHTVGPAPPGSIDDTFQRAGWPIFVLDLRRLPRSGEVVDWFSRAHPVRETGALFSSEEAMREDALLAEAFEAMIFIESTTRARPNPSGLRPPK